MSRLTFDRPFIARLALLWLILMWPILALNGPAFFEDSRSYFKGGAVAISLVTDKLRPEPEAADPRLATGAAPDKTKLVREAKGVRSIPYSVISYVLAGPGPRFYPLAAVQALLAAFCVVAALGPPGGGTEHRFWIAALVLGAATPLAPFAAYVMPDIFAGLTVLTLALLMTASARMSSPLFLALAAIAAFAITAHPSHILLAMAMVVIAGLVTLARAIGGDKAAFTTLWRTAAVVLLACATVIATGIIGFGEASLAPKRYPFVLARAVELAPARDYLNTTCQSRTYEVCRIFPDAMPTSSFDFLWSDQGIDQVATPDQMERLRQEEPGLIFDMVRAAPFAMTQATLAGVAEQLVTFDLASIRFQYAIRMISPIEFALTYEDTSLPTPLRWVQALTNWVLVLTLFGFVIWLRPRNRAFVFAILLIGGVVANAAVCSIFSTVASRYQARVIWLLPLAALVLWQARSAGPAGRGRDQPGLTGLSSGLTGPD